MQALLSISIFFISLPFLIFFDFLFHTFSLSLFVCLSFGSVLYFSVHFLSSLLFYFVLIIENNYMSKMSAIARTNHVMVAQNHWSEHGVYTMIKVKSVCWANELKWTNSPGCDNGISLLFSVCVCVFLFSFSIDKRSRQKINNNGITCTTTVFMVEFSFFFVVHIFCPICCRYLRKWRQTLTHSPTPTPNLNFSFSLSLRSFFYVYSTQAHLPECLSVSATLTLCMSWPFLGCTTSLWWCFCFI